MDKRQNNCFREFDDMSPKRKEPSVQVLYEYEKHYMEMVKKYSQEIKFINDMLRDLRQEQITFYGEILLKVENKLNEDKGIDDEMRKIWLNRLSRNIHRSFELSEILIHNYVTKKIDEFKTVVDKKLREL